MIYSRFDVFFWTPGIIWPTPRQWNFLCVAHPTLRSSRASIARFYKQAKKDSTFEAISTNTLTDCLFDVFLFCFNNSLVVYVPSPRCSITALEFESWRFRIYDADFMLKELVQLSRIDVTTSVHGAKSEPNMWICPWTYCINVPKKHYYIYILQGIDTKLLLLRYKKNLNFA